MTPIQTRFNELISRQLSTLTGLPSTTETTGTYRGCFDFSNSSCAVIEYRCFRNVSSRTISFACLSVRGPRKTA